MTNLDLNYQSCSNTYSLLVKCGNKYARTYLALYFYKDRLAFI